MRLKEYSRYLRSTIDIRLWYPKCDNFELICYFDEDFGGCKIDRKSTNRTCHFLGHSLVSWHSKKQNLVALSTTESEYIVHLWYPKCDNFELICYFDEDLGGCKIDRKTLVEHATF